VVTASEDHTARVWEAATGKVSVKHCGTVAESTVPRELFESELKIRRNAIEARKSLSVLNPDYIDHMTRQRPIH
jgi:hypothetical protein